VQLGDLLVWDNLSWNNGVDYIVIYVGNGKMIEVLCIGFDVCLVDVLFILDYICCVFFVGGVFGVVVIMGVVGVVLGVFYVD